MIAVALSTTMLGVAVPAASGAVDRTVSKCEGTATWQVTIDLSGPSSAVRTFSTAMDGCKRVHAGVADDGNFMINSYDNEDSGTSTPNLFGAGVTGVPAFVGVVVSPSGTPRGPIAIVGDSLTATVANADGPPSASVEEHIPDGSCGTNCYRTKAVWVVSYDGT